MRDPVECLLERPMGATRSRDSSAPNQILVLQNELIDPILASRCRNGGLIINA